MSNNTLKINNCISVVEISNANISYVVKDSRTYPRSAIVELPVAKSSYGVTEQKTKNKQKSR